MSVHSLGNTYNIPLCLWLMDTHPYNPPVCYIKPTTTMHIIPGRHVDSNGRVYLPYLHEWKHVRLLAQPLLLHSGIVYYKMYDCGYFFIPRLLAGLGFCLVSLCKIKKTHWICPIGYCGGWVTTCLRRPVWSANLCSVWASFKCQILFHLIVFAMIWCLFVIVLWPNNIVISGRALTCDSAHFIIYSSAPLGDQTYIPLSHYPDTEPATPCPILICGAPG